MPLGYLLTTSLLAWCTVSAVAPRRPAHSSPSNLSFFFGCLVNELPFVAFACLVASTGLAALQGDLDSPVGWVAFGLAVATTPGFVVIVRRQLRTGAALDHSLDEGLGTGWRSAIEPDLAGSRRHGGRWVRAVLWPFPVFRHDIERVADLRYGDGGRYHLLDVYRRRSRPPDGPTLVYLHGGAFRIGRKNREARPLLYRLASHGWVCISANYRLGRHAVFPDHLVDVKQVLAWVREHGPSYGADRDVVFVAGSSAGGHLAATAALTANDPAFQPGFERADTSVAGAIPLYGYYGPIDTGGAPSSPHDYVHRDAPPFFVAHGERDTVVIVEDARAFVAALRGSSSRPVVYAELPGGQHVFDLVHSLRLEPLIDAIEAFAAWVRSGLRHDPDGAPASGSAPSG